MKLYFRRNAPQVVTYKVEWYNAKGKTIKKTEERLANEGETVAVTDKDKKVKGYVFDKKNPKNNLQDVVAKDGSTTLKLYFKKKTSNVSEEPDKPSKENSSSNSGSSGNSSSSSTTLNTTKNNNNNNNGVVNNSNYPILVCPKDHAPSMSVDTWENKTETAKIPRTGENETNCWPYVILILSSIGLIVFLNKRKEDEPEEL